MQGLCYLLWKEKLDEADKDGVMAFVRRQKPLKAVIVSLGKCPWPSLCPSWNLNLLESFFATWGSGGTTEGEECWQLWQRFSILNGSVWTLKQIIYLSQANITFVLVLTPIYLGFWKFISYPSERVAFPSRTVYVALLLLPFCRCDSFFISGSRENTFSSKRTWVSSVLHISSLTDSSGFLTVLLVFLTEGSMKEKWFLVSRLFGGWKSSLWTASPILFLFILISVYHLQGRKAYVLRRT